MIHLAMLAPMGLHLRLESDAPLALEGTLRLSCLRGHTFTLPQRITHDATIPVAKAMLML